MSIYFLPSSPFLVSKDSNACFAISFCVLAIRKFSAGGAGGGGGGLHHHHHHLYLKTR